jgi:hypothetical protein
MRGALVALAVLAPLAAAAQGDPKSGLRFGQDVLAPLLDDTANMRERNRNFTDARPDGPLPRSRRCYALVQRAAEFRQLGLLPTSGSGLGPDAGRGAQAGHFRVDADLIRALLQRCREEVEQACFANADVKAVVQAVQSMAMIRNLFADLDQGRRANKPLGLGAFRRDIGDDDQSWMQRTLGRCARFELRWRSEHEHVCRDTSPNWRYRLEAALLVRVKVGAFQSFDESVFDIPLAFEIEPTAPTLDAAAPGRQRAGHTFSFTASDRSRFELLHTPGR